MPRYIIERNVDFASLSEEERYAIGKRANDVVATLPGVTWIRSYISLKEGKIYCEYEAPNPDVILDHARLTGIPADQISEVSAEVSPEMFR